MKEKTQLVFKIQPIINLIIIWVHFIFNFKAYKGHDFNQCKLNQIKGQYIHNINLLRETKYKKK